jgi:hypothetical protein
LAERGDPLAIHLNVLPSQRPKKGLSICPYTWLLKEWYRKCSRGVGKWQSCIEMEITRPWHRVNVFIVKCTVLVGEGVHKLDYRISAEVHEECKDIRNIGISNIKVYDGETFKVAPTDKSMERVISEMRKHFRYRGRLK